MRKLAVAALASLMAGPVLTPMPMFTASAATAQKSGHVYYRGRHYHRRHCGGGNGAVGTIAGGVGGGLIGKAVIGGPVGIVAGAVGGGLLGRHLDRKHTASRHRC